MHQLSFQWFQCLRCYDCQHFLCEELHHAYIVSTLQHWNPSCEATTFKPGANCTKHLNLRCSISLTFSKDLLCILEFNDKK